MNIRTRVGKVGARVPGVLVILITGRIAAFGRRQKIRVAATFDTAGNPSHNLNNFNEITANVTGQTVSHLPECSGSGLMFGGQGKLRLFAGGRPNRRIDLPGSSTMPRSMSRGQALTSEGLPMGRAVDTCLFSLSGCRLTPVLDNRLCLKECSDPQCIETIGLRTQGALARNEE
jgi:hypothetical protein